MGHKKPIIPYPKIGMRVVKTVVAVFICCIIDYLRGVSPIQSTIAAIICIQPDTKNSVNAAVSRVLAILLGSIIAMLQLMLFAKTGIKVPSISFYLILSLLLIPLITITVKMGWPSSTALTCIIFLSTVLGYTRGTDLFMAAINNMIEALVGILVALAVNILLPNPKAATAGEPEKEHTEPLQNQPVDDESPEEPDEHAK